jgi:hypothetical protein
LRKLYNLLIVLYLLPQQTLNNSTNLSIIAQQTLNKIEGIKIC